MNIKNMEFTGERYVPSVSGDIKYEHLHRYALCLDFVAGKSVLDIASGEGYGSASLAKIASHVTGVDISTESIQHAREKYQSYNNLDFLVGSCDAVPLSEKSVDIVVSFETIEHHGRHEEMMLEIKRVLRQDGILIVSSPNRLTYSDEPSYSNPHHVKELYYEELVTLLSRHFSYVKIYGQRIASASFIFPLSNASEMSIKPYTGDTDNIARKVCSLESPIYYVAVCSDDENNTTLPIDSIYIESTEDLLKELQINYFSQLQQHQQYIGRLESTAKATEDLLKELQVSCVSQHQQYVEELESIAKAMEASKFEKQETQAQLQQTQTQLQHCQEKVILMEASKFEKLRKIWVRIKKRTGLT
jgi:ubiquinone/menaquinone biosynthesis C-methylase UbiE